MLTPFRNLAATSNRYLGRNKYANLNYSIEQSTQCQRSVGIKVRRWDGAPVSSHHPTIQVKAILFRVIALGCGLIENPECLGSAYSYFRQC